MQANSIDFDKYIASYRDFPKPGILFRDISPLLASAKVMNCAIDQLAAQVSGPMGVFSGGPKPLKNT